MKKLNEYANALDAKLYAATPKAVFAAVAVSYCSAGGDNLADATARLLEEWRTLYANGIVPQKPPKNCRRCEQWSEEQGKPVDQQKEPA